jgi:hypothetical protein
MAIYGAERGYGFGYGGRLENPMAARRSAIWAIFSYPTIKMPMGYGTPRHGVAQTPTCRASKFLGIAATAEPPNYCPRDMVTPGAGWWQTGVLGMTATAAPKTRRPPQKPNGVTDKRSPDNLSPDNLSPDNLSPDNLSPDNMSPDNLSPDK